MGPRPALPDRRQEFVPPPPPVSAKAASTRRRLLDSASALFIRDGYHAVSMNDIALVTGLTKGALYGHFRSKGQLLVEVIRYKQAEREHSAEFVAALADSSTALELLFGPSGRDVRLLEVDAASAARHDPEIAAGLAELYGERLSRIADTVPANASPSAVTWFLGTITAGIGVREAVGMAFPSPEQMTAVLTAAIAAAVGEA